MPKGYFIGEKTQQTWTSSVLKQYFGTIKAWAEAHEEKAATVYSVLSPTWYPDCDYQPNRRVLSKLYHDGYTELLLKDKLITSKFIPIPLDDLYWTEFLVH